MKKLVNEGKLLIDGKPFTTVLVQIIHKDDPNTLLIEKGKITFQDPGQAELFTKIEPCHTELFIDSHGIVPIQFVDTPSRRKCTVRIRNCAEGKSQSFRLDAW